MATYQLVGRFLNAHGECVALNEACALGAPKGAGVHVGAWVQSMIAIEVEGLRLSCATQLKFLSNKVRNGKRAVVSARSCSSSTFVPGAFGCTELTLAGAVTKYPNPKTSFYGQLVAVVHGGVSFAIDIVNAKNVYTSVCVCVCACVCVYVRRVKVASPSSLIHTPTH